MVLTFQGAAAIQKEMETEFYIDPTFWNWNKNDIRFWERAECPQYRHEVDGSAPCWPALGRNHQNLEMEKGKAFG